MPIRLAEGNDQITQAQTRINHKNTPDTGVFTAFIPFRLIKIGRFSAKEIAINTCMLIFYTFISYSFF